MRQIENQLRAVAPMPAVSENRFVPRLEGTRVKKGAYKMVLEEAESFKTKEQSKLGALEVILQPEHYPDLYGSFDHMVRINYYPPRGDNKEGWDNIDLNGWLGYSTQLKVNFLCRDSILAAP